WTVLCSPGASMCKIFLWFSLSKVGLPGLCPRLEQSLVLWLSEPTFPEATLKRWRDLDFLKLGLGPLAMSAVQSRMLEHPHGHAKSFQFAVQPVERYSRVQFLKGVNDELQTDSATDAE
ncbi:MAG: hypothetical protein KC594_18205, partial [Nitrospira sp.]|nr:hypothetical protein [Nitrospira sp.]